MSLITPTRIVIRTSPAVGGAVAAARVSVRAAAPRAAVDIVGGAIVPRIVSRDPDGARVALVAGGALLLPGDTVRIEVTVGAGAWLDLHDVGGTVCYGERDASRGPAERATWDVRVRVESGGRLCWDGLPLVIAEGARVTRQTVVDLAPDATALFRETSVLGRSGESGGDLRALFRAAYADQPLLVEDLVVSGARPQTGVLGPHRVYDTVTALGFRPARAAGPEVLDLDGPGAVARYLGAHTHRSPLAEVFDRWQRGHAPDTSP